MHDGAPEQLPRRTQQEHLAPQLRDAQSAGTGTPFAAFTPATDDGGGDRPEPTERPTGVLAALRRWRKGGGGRHRV